MVGAAGRASYLADSREPGGWQGMSLGIQGLAAAVAVDFGFLPTALPKVSDGGQAELCPVAGPTEAGQTPILIVRPVRIPQEALGCLGRLRLVALAKYPVTLLVHKTSTLNVEACECVTKQTREEAGPPHGQLP